MSTVSPPSLLRQRADYTHKHNQGNDRHGWLRLTPAYSVKIVAELLAGLPPELVVLDPFCGTATTALVASRLGHTAFTTEINPFLVWYSGAKLDSYLPFDIEAARSLIDRSIEHVLRGGNWKSLVPNLHNIERWWGAKELDFLTGLLSSFGDFGTDRSLQKAENLVRVAFCRTLISLSNAAFNHQSMSFKDPTSLRLPFSDRLDVFVNLFLTESARVINAVGENPAAGVHVIHGDARSVGQIIKGKVDIVVTSPPYPNRMSYIRELRPYMYWLGFLSDARDAAELDWQAIGGTWGSATSRLKKWVAIHSDYESAILPQIVAEIASDFNPNGDLLATYVSKYFADTFEHFSSLTNVLSGGAQVHYIVGNSTFYGTLLPVERLYGEIMEMVGFSNVEIRPLRKRNSKKELIEFCVSAQYC